MPYRTERQIFTQAEFDHYQGAFWALPRAWGDADELPLLAELYSAGSSGIFAVLPILGWLAGLKAGRENWHFSIEALARLSRTDPKTIQKARQALEHRGLVATRLGWQHGKRLIAWSVSPRLSALGAAGDGDVPYFYFDHRLIYGANWAALTPGQRALYLGAATQAYTIAGPPEQNWLLKEVLRADTDAFDLQRTYRECTSDKRLLGADSGYLRLACASTRELCRVTGLSESAISDAAAGLKHPRLFPESMNDPYALEYAPLWVYPVRSGYTLLFHFRDYAPHVPWAAANAPGWRGLSGLASQLMPIDTPGEDEGPPLVYCSEPGVLDSDSARWERELC